MQSERLRLALVELNAAIHEVDPSARVETVNVVWRKGRVRLGGRLEQLLAWRVEGSRLARDIDRIARYLYR